MIEYYTFMHNGNAETYTDEVILRLVPRLSVAIFYGSKLDNAPKSQALLFSEILSSDEFTKGLAHLSSLYDECLDSNCEYLILRVLENGIESIRRGNVYAKIIRDGRISTLPNGFFGLSPDDRIICATSRFYESLTDEGILADAAVAGSCNEWMMMMVRRISDHNQLMRGNLSAVTLKLNE